MNLLGMCWRRIRRVSGAGVLSAAAFLCLSPAALAQSQTFQGISAIPFPTFGKEDENPRKIGYAPQENDPTIDPLNNRFNEWQGNMDKRASEQGTLRDASYEQFVRDVSGITFSLGEKQIPEASRELLRSIPAGSLKPTTPEVRVKNDATIERGESVDPFAAPLSDEVTLDIEVKEPDTVTLKLLQMGYQALVAGQYETAISVYQRVLDKEPRNVQALFGVANAYQRGGQKAEAKETYARILRTDNQHWPSLNNLMILVAEEAPEDALKELLSLEQSNPEFSPIPAHIASIYMKQERLDDAAKYLTRAVLLSPDNLYYRYNLAVLYDHMGRGEQAKNLYQQVVKAGLEGKPIPKSVAELQERVTYLSNQVSR